MDEALERNRLTIYDRTAGYGRIPVDCPASPRALGLRKIFPCRSGGRCVLAWAGNESAIPPLERASKRSRSPMIRDVVLTLRGDHGTLSASMGFFRAPHYRRLVRRAREIHERNARNDGPPFSTHAHFHQRSASIFVEPAIRPITMPNQGFGPRLRRSLL